MPKRPVHACSTCNHGPGRHRSGGTSCWSKGCECQAFVAGGVAPPPCKTRVPFSDKDLLDAIARGMSTTELAVHFGVSERTINRRQKPYRDQPATPPRITPEELDRVRLLVDEGMPVTWAVEDLGRPVQAVRRHIRPGKSSDWNSVWQSIRQNPTLLELHREFAPRRSSKLPLATNAPAS